MKKNFVLQKKMNNQTFTLTFGDCAENHVGMQKIGNANSEGLSYEELLEIKKDFENEGYQCILTNLQDLITENVQEAYFLVIKNGLEKYCCKNELFNEHNNLDKDTKALMRGRVVNKIARYNLCFSDFSQNPDYEKGMGTVVNFETVPFTNCVRTKLSMLNDKLKKLQCEGNYYYNIKKTYIGFHGDTERRIVVGIRLGEKFPIHFQWYHRFKEVGELFTYILEDGDMYFMSNKAVGYDWKKSSQYTLRHAAGNLSLFKKK